MPSACEYIVITGFEPWDACIGCHHDVKALQVEHMVYTLESEVLGLNLSTRTIVRGCGN